MTAQLASVLVLAAACGPTATTTAPTPPPPPWSVPAGWHHEAFPFPLGFAPTLAHRGLEEVRLPPGFADATAADYWSYAFVWRLDDPATLEPATLAAELAAYFRGLLADVDGDKHRLDPTQITVTAIPGANGLALTAHVIDTFGAATPVDLVGTARRVACGGGALWTFVVAPATSTLRPMLDALAATAVCGQPTAPK